jgi:anti-anti-sigma factor
MEIFELQNGKTKIIKVSGEMDFDRIEKFRKELEQIDLFIEVLIDLAGVTYVDSNFINLMIQIRNQRPFDYKKIKILNPNNLVTKVLTLNRLDSVYEIQNIYPTAW